MTRALICDAGSINAEDSSDRLQASAWRKKLPVVLCLVVFFGVICRITQYAARTSVWHDEAFVALNVQQNSYHALLGPLDWNEAAPPGFLMIEKFVTDLLGDSEYAFRLIPLLAGIAGLAAFAWLALRLSTSVAAALVAVIFMAASLNLVAQSNQIKHFTIDTLWAVLILACTWRILTSARPLFLVIWGIIGAAGLWISYAALFTFAAASIVIATRAFLHWSFPRRLCYLSANIALAASLFFLLGPIRAQRVDPLLSYWTKTESFPDWSGPFALLFWLARSLIAAANFFWRDFGALVLALIILGAVHLWRAGLGTRVLYLLLPFGASLAASFLHLWPFGANQHMAFAAPGVLILAGEGAEALRRRLSTWRPWAAAVWMALLLIPGVGRSMYHIFYPRERHEVRPIIEFVQKNRRPGDQLLVFDPATVQFYTGQDFRRYTPDLTGSSRIWFVSSRPGMKNTGISGKDLLQEVARRRRRLLAIEQYGAVGYLFGVKEEKGRGGAESSQ